MKTTKFHAIHLAAGAKMVSFAGFEMPIQYPTGIIAEHKTVRSGVGIFDVSHMGEFFVSGPDSLAFKADAGQGAVFGTATSKRWPGG
jgi:aminomethyltransferase